MGPYRPALWRHLSSAERRWRRWRFSHCRSLVIHFVRSAVSVQSGYAIELERATLPHRRRGSCESRASAPGARRPGAGALSAPHPGAQTSGDSGRLSVRKAHPLVWMEHGASGRTRNRRVQQLRPKLRPRALQRPPGHHDGKSAEARVRRDQPTWYYRRLHFSAQGLRTRHFNYATSPQC